MMDYEERPDSEASCITFLPGQREQVCVVVLVDDSEHEEEEEFRLVLGIPSGQSRVSLLLGQQQDVVIHVTDEKDRSVICFSETRYTVREPVSPDEVAVVRVAVRRLGDLSRVSVVRVHTRDGSAHSGQDYTPLSQGEEGGGGDGVLWVFSDGQSEHVLEVQVLFDQERETRETFTLHLTPDRNMVAHTQACDPRHPAHPLTSPHCLSEGLNSSLTEFRWLLGPPGAPLRGQEAGPLAGGRGLLLDQLYLQPGVRVQCCGRAVSSEGRAGQEVCSPLVEVSTTEGMCPPSSPGVVGAEPYSAKLRYTGPDDAAHPNLLRLTVTMAHVDGLIPLVSTRPLSSLSLTLTQHASLQDHRCSNLQGPTLQPNTTRLGLTWAGQPGSGGGPLLRSPAAQRGGLSLGFYRSLDLEACVWSFTGHYSIGELLSDCGGTVESDGQVLEGVQSYVTLRVPLYVSYLHSAPSAPGGWVTFDLRSDLRLTFTYETSILWRDGIATPPDAPLQGSLYPTSMRINSEGRLVVTFRTQARFRGHFILSHPAVRGSSEVLCEERPSLLLSLSLLDSTHSTQTWSFTSQLA
ncbi:FRAS1-related extracellular matrix protein 2-like, partial [Osmerus eperlanus]|uniref:FRAS1-related extracellular matrix protein 2-like n=1 Tax=Osmerus eperlanus TaxID=29151 RepID=UPI002E0F85AB